MGVKQVYPEAYEDEKGTIWTSKQAADAADWTWEHGDGFLSEVLGWSWEDAEENLILCQSEAKRKEFWRAHPHLRKMVWFTRRRWGFTAMFLSTVWRDWYGRISWSTAWQIASDVWLR